MNILVGNMITLVASLMMVIASYIKDKQKSLLVNAVQLIVAAASGVALGAYSAVIVNLLGIPRNLLVAYDKMTSFSKSVLIWFAVAFYLLFGTSGVFGLFPFIVLIAHILLLDIVNPIQYKYLTIVSAVLWATYDFITHNYVASVFDVATLVAATIAVVRLHKVN